MTHLLDGLARLDPQIVAGLLAVTAALIGAAGHLGAAYLTRPPESAGRLLLHAIADRLGRRREPTLAERLADGARLMAPVALALLGAVLLLWR